MNKLVKKGIKNLREVRKDAVLYAKNTYNDFAKPVVRSISKKIAKIDLNGIYKDSLKAADEAKGFVRKSSKLIKASTNKIVRSDIIKTAQKTTIANIKRAQRFMNRRVPFAKATVISLATTNFIKAKRYINKTYPKIQKFVKVNYPNAKAWIAEQLPKVEAFIAGQLSARVQKFAA
jgi:hypothetical protein